MVMDSKLNNVPHASLNQFNLDGGTVPSISNPNFASEPLLRDDSLDFNFLDFPSPIPDPNLNPDLEPVKSGSDPVGGVPDSVPSAGAPVELDSPDENDFSDTVVKFISDMLMEEDIENKLCMFHDPSALEAAEKSFYDVIGKEYTPSPDQPPLYVDIPDSSFSSDYSQSSSSGNSTGNSVGFNDIGVAENDPTIVQIQSFLDPINYASQSAVQAPFTSPNNLVGGFNALVDYSVSTPAVPDVLNESESASFFRRGVEEASKFLPPENLLVTELENYGLAQQSKDNTSELIVEAEENVRESLPNASRGRKNHHREDVSTEEGRNAKQSAISVNEDDLSEMFDRVLLHSFAFKCTEGEAGQNGACELPQPNGQLGGGRGSTRKRGNKREVVDLRTLLVLCAEAVNADDHRTADKMLKQLRQHSSPFGDGLQRLAHYFVNALEARLAGTGTQIYASLNTKGMSAADMLKAYQLYLSASPFKQNAVQFLNHHILKLAEKAVTIHVIDFGIRYGFQWPIFIKYLSKRVGGPPKLRITGIDFPQPGFRPAESVEETGHRLASYCKRFNVPFEYNAIAQKWETVRIEDLKIGREEVIVVNCFLRFENLLDETVVVSSPRDAVLKLIRKINPNLFTLAIVNGSFNSPFFITRFKELLFHFSALFDIFDTNLPRENEDRLMFEKGFLGREIMNVIACEGSERTARPEMYKQWQIRIARAGFRQLPLDNELMKKLRTKQKACYHKDFAVDEDGNWMLQGWKGRILNAATTWVPVQ